MRHTASLSKEFLQLLKNGREYRLRKGQIIQSTEDRKVFNLVESGYIKRYLIGSDGSLGVQVLYGPGDIFPITLAFHELIGMEISESQEVYYYETITNVVLYTIPVEKLVGHIEKNPQLYRDLMAIAGRRLHSTLSGLENLTMRSSYKRLAHQLTYLGRRFGEPKARGIKILVPLSPKDLADILSLSRETINANLEKLREKGLIKTGNYIVIKDMSKLNEEAFS